MCPKDAFRAIQCIRMRLTRTYIGPTIGYHGDGGKKVFPNRKFGELMIERDLIDKNQLSVALKKQQETGTRIGSILVGNGDITEEQLGDFLSFYYDVPKIDLSHTQIPSHILSLLDKEFMGNAGVIPFKIIEDATGCKTLMLAMVDPTDDAAIEKVGNDTRMIVEPFVMTHGLFLKTYKRLIENDKSIETILDDFETRDLVTALIKILHDRGMLSKEEIIKVIGSGGKSND